MGALQQDLRAVVVLASAGRPALLADALACTAAQTGWETRVVVSVPDERSLPVGNELLSTAQLVLGSRGLAAQRNAALDALDEVDIVVFFDDDAVVRADYVAQAIAFFKAHPDVVGITGEVLLDGAVRGEVSRELADETLAASAGRLSGAWRRTRELYGCNFAYRIDIAPEIRFDARLPLYSWLEDHDFARRLMAFGRIAHVDDCVIVHRAAASGGRQAHVRLGYSQVMNPIYLHHKGSFPFWLAAQQIFRPVAKNLVLSVAGSARPWRRERLMGNLLATTDVMWGRITPERIVEL